MKEILKDADQKMTQLDILEQWPEGDAAPDRTTLTRCLKRAERRGQLFCSGRGRRSAPLRYWLVENDALIYPGDDVSDEEFEAWDRRVAAHWEKEKGKAD